MAVGKNKRLVKKGKGRKKVTDPFLRKEWYDIKAPALFAVRNVGKTLVSRTQGTKIASDGLKGRIIDVSLGDLNKDDDQVWRKMNLRVEDVAGRNCLTNFYGMDFTSDKLKSLVKKWHSLIEASVDVKTTDQYVLRLFCIAFTRRRPNQIKKTSYAKSSQIRSIRAKMIEIMTREATTTDLQGLVKKLIPESMGKEIEKACQSIYPLQNVYVRKCKVLKTPKYDATKLQEIHQSGGDDAGTKLDRPIEL